MNSVSPSHSFETETVEIIGTDQFGYQVVAAPEFEELGFVGYRLTKCCSASGTGSYDFDEDGNEIPAVVCRSCYQVVEDRVGGPVAAAEIE